ncbi:hypothetical protein CB1_000526034 [Camelus ferus]|nr:hypothetical protein CB1_000526034 [Camelus ferus]
MPARKTLRSPCAQSASHVQRGISNPVTRALPDRKPRPDRKRRSHRKPRPAQGAVRDPLIEAPITLPPQTQFTVAAPTNLTASDMAEVPVIPVAPPTGYGRSTHHPRAPGNIGQREQQTLIQDLQRSNMYLEKKVEELQMKTTKQQVSVDIMNKLKENVEELIEDKYRVMLEKNDTEKTLRNVHEVLVDTQQRLQESRNEKETLQRELKKIKSNYVSLQERYMTEMQQKKQAASQCLMMDRALSKKEEEVERLQQLKGELEEASTSALGLLKREQETREQELLSLQEEFQKREKENLDERRKLKSRLEKLVAQVQNLQFTSDNEKAKNTKLQQQIDEVKNENAKLQQQVARSEEQKYVPKSETVQLKERLEEVMESDMGKLLKHKDRITTFRELIANEKSFQDQVTEVTDFDSNETKNVRDIPVLLGAKLDQYHNLNEELDFLIAKLGHLLESKKDHCNRLIEENDKYQRHLGNLINKTKKSSEVHDRGSLAAAQDLTEDEETVEDSIIEDEDDEAEVEEDEPTDLVEDKEEEDVSGEPEASPSADTTILFVKGEDFPANNIVKFLVGFTNKGTEDFIVESLDASFRYPQDYQFYIQNFTALPLNTVVPPQRQATFEYSFIPAEPMGGRPFGLVINLNYKDLNGNVFQDAVFNQTVTIIEREDGLDGETTRSSVTSSVTHAQNPGVGVSGAQGLLSSSHVPEPIVLRRKSPTSRAAGQHAPHSRSSLLSLVQKWGCFVVVVVVIVLRGQWQQTQEEGDALTVMRDPAAPPRLLREDPGDPSLPTPCYSLNFGPLSGTPGWLHGEATAGTVV